MPTKIVFIGGGNMAEAIFGRLNLINYDITVIQHNSIKLNQLKTKYSAIRFLNQLTNQLMDTHLVILAVKPQDAKTTCTIINKLTKKATIISVMAGIKTTTLEYWLNNYKIIRAMPNILSSLGLGITGLYFSPLISKDNRTQVTKIFNSIGKTYTVENEESINKITAIGASSPAYILYFLENMIESAIKLGFSPKDASDITIQVARGSVSLIENNPNMSIAQLRQLITSKKGTTHAAITILEQANLKNMIYSAEQACIQRAEELSNNQE